MPTYGPYTRTERPGEMLVAGSTTNSSGDEVPGFMLASLPGRVFRLRFDGYKVLADFEDTLSDEEKIILARTTDSFFTGLDALRTKRFGEIDQRTSDLIDEGFTFDGKVFSASINAQSNWHWVLSFANNNWLSFPVTISTKNHGEYILDNAADVDSFIQNGFSQIKGHLDSGRVLKKSITDAADEDAIKGDR